MEEFSKWDGRNSNKIKWYESNNNKIIAILQNKQFFRDEIEDLSRISDYNDYFPKRTVHIVKTRNREHHNFIIIHDIMVWK